MVQHADVSGIQISMCIDEIISHTQPFKIVVSKNVLHGIQWGPFKIQKHLKSRLFEGWIANGLVLKMVGLKLWL